ncbi:MAG: AAA family ATPase, partial [Deltaproteobacteria bacterium]|nr:AAA family ATPase [Deltaproteobacteria bacterium]
LPAMQARAVLYERDYVSPRDLEVLAPYVFSHRLELAPGHHNSESIVREAVKRQVERLEREVLRNA